VRILLSDSLKDRSAAIDRIIGILGSLDVEVPWEVTVERLNPPTGNQRGYLWSLYRSFLKDAPEHLRGYTADDLHELWLGEHYGWEGEKPIVSTSFMDKAEVSEHIEYVLMAAAEAGVILDDPR